MDIMLLNMEKSCYDQIKREQGIIEKAVRNDAVMTLYERFKRLLPDSNPELLSDTILKLTATYDPNQDFVEQFKSTWNELAQCFQRSNYYTEGFHASLEDFPAPEEEDKNRYDIINDKELIQDAVVETAAKATKGRKRRAKKA